jgi:hypothetical protein
MPFDNPAPSRPAYSILTAPGAARTVGADWPEWQRNLYPVTYSTDRAFVERMRGRYERELARDRFCLWASLKQRDRLMVRAWRRDIDRKARYVRNCETQLRLIDAAVSFMARAA